MMKTILTTLVLGLLVLAVMPGVFANDVGIDLDIDFETEPFQPLLWMCDHRSVIDDPIETGRVDGDEVCSLKYETQEQCEAEGETDGCEWHHDGGKCIL